MIIIIIIIIRLLSIHLHFFTNSTFLEFFYFITLSCMLSLVVSFYVLYIIMLHNLCHVHCSINKFYKAFA